MSTVRPGDVLAGKYRVERVLGSGGMGYVVAARHLQLDQLVAMKFLRCPALDNDEATGRFLREAKAVVKLKNEHVARVFDVGTLETGEPYIVMEYLDGCDLSALAKERGQIPVSEAVEYILQACESLGEAHSLGIIHRDVKLANLFLTRGPAGSPLVKVLDFGISKTNPFGESEHDMTRTSSMLGSPRFMSPEQMRDPRAVDPRSDIWSLGVVLYRLVAGRPPFESETLGRLLTMVMHEPYPALSTARTGLPPGFEQVVGMCLEKDPARRFSNVAELAYGLAPYAASPVRARAIADSIAATLSVAQVPRTIELEPRLATTSGAPAASDAGTAAPWVGTHGGGGLPARSSLIWAAVVLVGILVCAGLFVKVTKHAPAAANAGALTAGAAEPDPAASGALALPPTLPLTAEVVATSALPPPPMVGWSATPDAKKRAPVPPASPRKSARPSGNTAGSATTTGGAHEGIPPTRD